MFLLFSYYLVAFQFVVVVSLCLSMASSVISLLGQGHFDYIVKNYHLISMKLRRLTNFKVARL